MRANGGIIGPKNTPTQDVASGIWTLAELFDAKRKNIWPIFLSPKWYSWGWNNWGQLGTNNTTQYSSPIQVGTDTNWKSIKGSYYHTIALKNTGTLWAAGYNAWGQLGNFSTTTYSSPIQIGTDTNWAKISNTLAGTGGIHTTAIKSTGTLWAWGYGQYGQLGNNVFNSNSSSPIQVGANTDWVAVSNSQYSTLAIRSPGTLWAWGYGSEGQLGINTLSNYNSPVQVGAGTTWKDVSTGSSHTLALKTDGTLWSWGNNQNGQLGYNTTYTYSCFICTASSGYPDYQCTAGYNADCEAIANKSSPVQVGASTNWAKIFTGGLTSFAIKTDGTLWVWGYGGYGQTGLSNSADYSSPVQVGALTNWHEIANGGSHTLAIKKDGTLWAWGHNGHGELGTNYATSFSSPIQVGSVKWTAISTGLYTSLGLTQS